MEAQKVDLYSPIISARKGPSPIAIRVATQGNDVYTVNGPTAASIRMETYILLSALPVELKNKVETAIQALIAGM